MAKMVGFKEIQNLGKYGNKKPLLLILSTIRVLGSEKLVICLALRAHFRKARYGILYTRLFHHDTQNRNVYVFPYT